MNELMTGLNPKADDRLAAELGVTLLPEDFVNQTAFAPNGRDCTTVIVSNGKRFRRGDLVRPDGSYEIIFVSSVSGNVLTVVRRYGGSEPFSLANGTRLINTGNATLSPEQDEITPTFHTSDFAGPPVKLGNRGYETDASGKAIEVPNPMSKFWRTLYDSQTFTEKCAFVQGMIYARNLLIGKKIANWDDAHDVIEAETERLRDLK